LNIQKGLHLFLKLYGKKEVDVENCSANSSHVIVHSEAITEKLSFLSHKAVQINQLNFISSGDCMLGENVCLHGWPTSPKAGSLQLKFIGYNRTITTERKVTF